MFHSPKCPDHLQSGYTAGTDFADVAAPQHPLDVVQQIGPVVREVACDDVFEGVRQLNRDQVRLRRGEEGKQGRFESITVGGGDGGLVGSLVRWFNEVGRVYTILQVYRRSLLGCTVDPTTLASATMSARVEDAHLDVIAPDDLQDGRDHALLASDLERMSSFRAMEAS